MSKIYGYARVSTAKQSIQRQIDNIKAEYPSAIIVKDAWTGTEMNRPNWNKLYKNLQQGDSVVFDEVSRMSRDAEEGSAVYAELFSKGVNLIFLKEPHINTAVFQEARNRQIEITMQSGSEPIDKFGNGIIALINELLLDLAKEQIKLAFTQAEKEVTFLRQRTVEGLATAKLNGKHLGQAKGAKLTTKKSIAAKEIIKKHSKDFNGTLCDADVITLAGISRNSFYKYKRELRSEM